jgi:4a-hydroxytetrahydrobiopterin dehydratase
MTSGLAEKRCLPCEGGVPGLGPTAASALLPDVPGWSISEDGKWLVRRFAFENFHQTMAFVNAVAWVAHTEDHHPDLEVGYSACLVRYSTHAVGGLTENDFICAAKVSRLRD